MGLNTKCPKHGNLHPDFLCPDKERNTYKYRLKWGGKIVHHGITYDLVRREAEHQKDYPGSIIEQVGQRTTHKEALKWLERKMKKQNSKEAFIISLATDQGTGGSYCSNCNHRLDEYLKEWTKEVIDALKDALERNESKQKSEGFYKCPKCGAKLEWGGIYCPTGGSDF